MELKISDISFGYSDKAVGGVQYMNLESGGLNFLIGPNGIGKSTLLKTIAGHIPPIGQGEIKLDGQNLSLLSAKARSQKTSYLHGDRVNSRISVEQFLLIGLLANPIHLETNKSAKERIRTNCSTFGMEGILSKYIGQISDGEFQKTLILLNVLRDCPVLLLDEPLSHLDPPSQIEVLTLFKKISDNHIILISSHNLEYVRQYGRQVYAMCYDNRMQTIEKQYFKSGFDLESIYGEKMKKNILQGSEKDF